jgi:hypothetical protein
MSEVGTEPTGPDRGSLITRYADGHAAVCRALEGVTDAELDRRPPGGGWTARQVVHHPADSETRSYVRLRQLLAEDRPVIQGYDEAAYAEAPLLGYDRAVDASLAVLGAVRAASTELLVRLSGEVWSRAGTHSESGTYDLDTWLRIYAAHAHDHADQIGRARRGED